MRTVRGLRGVVLAGCLIAAVVATRSTDAALNASTSNPGSYFETTSLYAPSNLTATATGHDVALSWSAGQNGDGYGLLGASVASSGACASATLSAIGSSTGLSYTDTGRYAPQGSWFCYEAQTTASSWTSVLNNPRASVQIGAVMTSFVVANGGTAFALDPGDTVTITFNQAIDPASTASGTNSICVTSASSPNAVFLLGATATTGTCSAGEPFNLVKLTGGGSNRNGRWAATYAWSNGNKVLTVTLGARTSGTGNVNISGAFVVTPTTDATKLLTATGAHHVCDTNTGGGTCIVTPSGST